MHDTHCSPRVENGPQGHEVHSDEQRSVGAQLMQEEPSLTFEALYQRYGKNVYRRLYGLVGQHEQAEDLTQEVFLKVWRAWPPSSSEHLSGWLATIALRTAHDAWRKQQIRPACQSLEALLGWLDEVASSHDAAETALARLAFRTAWSRLPTLQRALLMRKACGATLAELAREEGCHRSAILQRLARARLALRQRYEEAGR